jgi:alpha-N-arabinofuranosidase
MNSRIRITGSPVYEGTISPFIYGEFVEFIDDLIPGMWAERIRDRSFEGLSRPTHFYRKERDFPRPAWRETRLLDSAYGSSPLFGVAFELDASRPFAGSRSACFRVGGQPGFLAGIAQDHVGVRSGERLNIELHMRGEALGGKVHVWLGRDYGAYADRYDEVVFDGIDEDWRRFKGVLNCHVTDPDACFSIVLDGPGTLWVDKVSVMPSDSLDGWRPDVVRAVKAAKPGIVRFGGSSLIYYDWRKGIGPRERRTPFLNRPWNNIEENDVGLDEFLRFCELAEVQPLICINSNSSTPQDIADEVEYTNGPVDSPYGRLRAENGHPAPYGVTFWQIGNEQSGEPYERILPEYAAAMKRVDPTIRLLASYPSENIIHTLSTDLDFVCPHFYAPDIASAHKETARLRSLIAASPRNPGMKLGVTEWNHTAGDWGEGRAWLQTLYNGIFVARMLNHFQRNGDLIRIANRSNLVNSYYSGSIQTTATDIYFTPAYHVQKLYSTTSGQVAVQTETDAADLDISGTMDADSSRFMVWVVNPLSQAVESTVSLDATGEVSSVRCLTITGTDPTAVNSFGRKENVAPYEEAVKPTLEVRWKFPPYSVTGIEFAMQGASRIDEAPDRASGEYYAVFQA